MSWLQAVQRQVEIRDILLTLVERAEIRNDQGEIRRLSKQVQERNQAIARMLARANVPPNEWQIYSGINPNLGPHEEHIHYPWPDPPPRRPPDRPYTQGMAISDWFFGGVLGWTSMHLGWPRFKEPGPPDVPDDPPPPNGPIDIDPPTFGPPSANPTPPEPWYRRFIEAIIKWASGG